MSKPFGIIYKATNLINGKCYIGQTSKTLDKRKHEHQIGVKKYPFQNAINKYGYDNFEWEILCECEDKLILNIRETMKIIVEHSHISEGGYNLTWGGDGQIKGWCPSEETRRKMSAGQRKRIHVPLTENHKEKLRKPKTEEHKKKLSEINKKYSNEDIKLIIQLRKEKYTLKYISDYTQTPIRTIRRFCEEYEKRTGRKIGNHYKCPSLAF